MTSFDLAEMNAFYIYQSRPETSKEQSQEEMKDVMNSLAGKKPKRKENVN